MAKQLFLNNFTSVFAASVKDAPISGTPATELDYGILRLSDGAAGVLVNPVGGDYYVLTAYKKSGTTETAVEIMTVTAVDNSVVGECRITVTRAQEGTTAKGYVSGDYVSLRLTKGGAANLVQESALSLKADLANPTFTGTVGGITAAMVGAPSGSGTSSGANTGDNAVNSSSTPAAHAGAGGAAHANAVAAGAAGFMTGADKTKLDGIAASANNYTHPANHAPSIITQDATNRFVTDAEKTAWNAKQAALASGANIKTVGGVSLLGSGDVSVGGLTVSVVAGTTQTAVAGSHYVLTNVAATTVTLPASPASGDTVWVTVANALYTNVIARNGQTIMGSATDMTIDSPTTTVRLRFVNSDWKLV